MVDIFLVVYYHQYMIYNIVPNYIIFDHYIVVNINYTWIVKPTVIAPEIQNSTVDAYNIFDVSLKWEISVLIFIKNPP